MSSKPLRFLGIEIDLSGKKATDDLADWNKEVRQALGLADDYTDGVDDMAREMREYAKKIGLTKEQLKELQETSRKNSEVKEFAKKYGYQADQIKRLGAEAAAAREKISNLKGIIGGLAAIGIGAFVKNSGGEMVKLAQDAEATALTFEVMLKSKEKGQEILSMLKEFSDVTPFSDTESIMAGKQLINAKVPLDQLKSTLTDIGNVAAGSGVKFAELAEIYAKNKMSGIIQGEDVNQLAGRGLPIMDALAKAMGVKSEQIRSLTAAGAIKFQHLQKAFQLMSKDDYPGLMDRLSMSGAGLSSTFESKFTALKKTLGDVLLEGLKPLYLTGISFFDWLQKNRTAMNLVKSAFLALIPVIGTLMVAALCSAATAAGALIAELSPILVVVGLVGGAIIGLILIIEDLLIWFKGGNSVFGGWLEKTFGIKPQVVLEKIKFIKTKLGEIFKPLIDAIGPFWGILRTLFSSIWGAVKVILGVVWDIIKFVAPAIGFIIQIIGKLLGFILWVVAEILGGWINMIGQVIERFAWLISKITSMFKALYDSIKAVLGKFFDFLFGNDNSKEIRIYGDLKQTAGIAGYRAGGGDIEAGSSYVVGEEGPEIFSSDRSGYIIPNHAISGGKKTNITVAPVFNISGVSDPEAVASLAIKKIESMIPLIAAELGFGLG